MKRIFMLLAVVGLVSVDAPAAGMNLLELIGLGTDKDSGAHQEPEEQQRQPIHVERESSTNFVEQAVTDVVATNVMESAETNLVEQATTDVMESVVTNYVEQAATNVVGTNVMESMLTNDVAEATCTNSVASTNNVELVAPMREPGPPRITSNKVYYDRKEGYAVFTGRVHVDTEEYQLHAKKAYVFFEGTNELKRIVATGNVAITNETRRAYGTKASYYRNTGMVVLYGDDEAPAEVRDEAKNETQYVKGSKIKFWTTSEQVEVVDANISAPVTEDMKSVKKELLPK